MMNQEQRKIRALSRRRKRKAKTNGDRQYFAAVRHLRRAEIRKWKEKHKPEKLMKELKQQVEFAKKREARDNAKETTAV